MFPFTYEELEPARAVVLDPLMVVAEMLRDPELAAGFKPEFKKKSYYSNPSTCTRLEEAQNATREIWGENVNMLVLNISSDKTEENLFPVYVTCANLDKKVYSKEKAIGLVGFCPSLPYSRAKFYELCQANGITTEERHKEAYKLASK